MMFSMLPAGDGHLPAALGGGVQHLLDPVDVGGEGGDDDPLVAVPGTWRMKVAPTVCFGGGVAGALYVGGVGQHRHRTPSLPSSPKRARSITSPVDGGGCRS